LNHAACKSRKIFDQDAILFQLFQVGENLARIRDIAPESFETAPESWNRIIGLRNLIAHEYRIVDPNRIWQYLEHDLAELRQTTEALDAWQRTNFTDYR